MARVMHIDDVFVRLYGSNSLKDALFKREGSSMKINII